MAELIRYVDQVVGVVILGGVTLYGGQLVIKGLFMFGGLFTRRD